MSVHARLALIYAEDVGATQEAVGAPSRGTEAGSAGRGRAARQSRPLVFLTVALSYCSQVTLDLNVVFCLTSVSYLLTFVLIIKRN